MVRLLHHKLDPHSRLIRLMAAEYSASFEMSEISPWKRDPEFLKLSPAATLPVMIDQGAPAIVGVLANLHYVEEMFAPNPINGLIPAEPGLRTEMWRLIEWAIIKLNGEVTQYVLDEKVGKRDTRSGTPDTSILRAAKANLVEHLHYFDWLFASRSWAAGNEMTLADFALAAHLSCLDYLGDVAWEDHRETKDWYARMKSRPSFRPLLSDRLVGTPASPTYADLDF
ncbi:MAG: glutathione S-transferase family protein [Hyphomicrobiaceae bacterium]|nr:glutathione S-transferase family protein [Hyphomicrobiaceae bacterium]MCC0023915.1 glutathione S-transferase family protein [Hyphomicrobiaceae bacterium]